METTMAEPPLSDDCQTRLNPSTHMPESLSHEASRTATIVCKSLGDLTNNPDLAGAIALTRSDNSRNQRDEKKIYKARTAAAGAFPNRSLGKATGRAKGKASFPHL